MSFNSANNQVIGYSYDAAGNLLSDGLHSYTYDAEGNVLQVDGGSTATYIYDAFNHRVQSSMDRQYVYDLNGRRVSTWDGTAANLSLVSATTYWNGRPISLYNGATYFQHQDVLGTERLLTASDGSAVGSYQNLAFGDQFSVSGTDNDSYHFAQLDHDAESGTDHAQFRQYSPTQGRWMSPDPYNGSMDPSNPQSFNRYSYVGNMPLSLTDPTGLVGEGAALTIIGQGTSICVKICAWAGPVGWAAAGVSGLLELTHILGLWGGAPAFNGSLHPRPNAPSNCNGGKPLKGPPGYSPSKIATAFHIISAINPVAAPGYLGLASLPHSLLDFKTLAQAGTDLYQQYVNFGNYVYGANCAAVGLGAGTCGSLAGQATKLTNHGSLDNEGGLYKYPYGDQATDAQYVQQGYADYVNNTVCQ